VKPLSGEGSFGALPLRGRPWLCCINWMQAQPAPTDVPDQAATSQSSLMIGLPETLGLHKMQSSSSDHTHDSWWLQHHLMAWSGGQKNHWQSFSAPLCNGVCQIIRATVSALRQQPMMPRSRCCATQDWPRRHMCDRASHKIQRDPTERHT